MCVRVRVTLCVSVCMYVSMCVPLQQQLALCLNSLRASGSGLQGNELWKSVQSSLIEEVLGVRKDIGGSRIQKIFGHKYLSTFPCESGITSRLVIPCKLSKRHKGNLRGRRGGDRGRKEESGEGGKENGGRGRREKGNRSGERVEGRRTEGGGDGRVGRGGGRKGWGVGGRGGEGGFQH